ncbi:MAG TPA: MauE/DoxX family redox-associated membrane protein [Acidimicrobiales bacterium]|nr:MauE/DoxX family redox-associated membrane protein [Acidimicrobiales bacterium]
MTAGLGYVAALILAGTLGWAAAVKLQAPDATRRAFVDLGLPAPGGLARVVPAVEIMVALALASRPADGALAALVLLAGFTTLLAITIVSGRAAGCGCFGGKANAPVTWVAVARNGFLAVLAFAALFAPRPVRPDPADVVLVALLATSAMVMLMVADRRRTHHGEHHPT